MVSLEYRMFLAFLFFTGGIVRADEPVQEILARAPYYYIDYRINQNGSFTVDRAWQTQVLNEKALEDVKQLSFSYSTSIETAKIIEAYTLKANGKKIIVPKKSYQLTVNGGKDSNTAIFSDVTTMTSQATLCDRADRIHRSSQSRFCRFKGTTIVAAGSAPPS